MADGRARLRCDDIGDPRVGLQQVRRLRDRLLYRRIRDPPIRGPVRCDDHLQRRRRVAPEVPLGQFAYLHRLRPVGLPAGTRERGGRLGRERAEARDHGQPQHQHKSQTGRGPDPQPPQRSGALMRGGGACLRHCRLGGHHALISCSNTPGGTYESSLEYTRWGIQMGVMGCVSTCGTGRPAVCWLRPVGRSRVADQARLRVRPG